MAKVSKIKKLSVPRATREEKLRREVFDKWPAEACGLADQVEAMEKVVLWLLHGKRGPQPVPNIVEIAKRK